MVGVDLVLVLCYCDEYKLVLGEQCGDFYVLLVNEWLVQEINVRLFVEVSGELWYFFGYCMEVMVLFGVFVQWVVIFVYFGVKLENVSVGCCGMVGIYGYEFINYKNLLGIYELFWYQVM